MAILLTFKKFRKINQNTMARDTARIEGKKISLPIGQIKECQRILLGLLGTHWQTNPRGVIALIKDVADVAPNG